MIPKLGFSLQSKYERPMEEVLALLKANGFDAVSPVWTPELDLPALAEYVSREGMTIQSLHAPLKNFSLTWQPDVPESLEVQQNVLSSLDACEKFHIPVLVVHSWQGLEYTFPDTPLDFRFFDKLVVEAEHKGIVIAFENLEGEEYLEALLTRYQAKAHVGFCWDSGHDHCYPHKTAYLERYGHRLMMTHINDNFGLRDPGGVPSGKDDLHFLPYDGNIDWQTQLKRLAKSAPQQTLNFEIKIISKSSDYDDLIYTRLSLEEFMEHAGKIARQFAERYEASIREVRL